MPSLFQTLQQEDADLGREADAIIEAGQRAHERGDREHLFTEEEQTRMAAINGRRERITGELATLGEHREAQRRTIGPAAEGDQEGPITPVLGIPAERPRRGVSDVVINDEAFRSWLGRVAPNGVMLPNATVGTSPSIAFPSILPGRAGRGVPGGLVTQGASSGGAFTVPDDTGIYDEGTFQRELTILDVITRGRTDTDAVEFVRMTAFTNNAAPVAEADNVSTADDTGRKPQSTMTFERVSDTVKTIAHWEAATSRSLADGGQLQTIIESQLRYGLLEELEDQIVAGDAIGENFTGILEEANVQGQLFDTDLITTTRRARTKVRTGGRARANAYLFHPNDWEEIDLEMTTGGGGSNYRQAADSSIPRLWGLPVIESEAVPEGTGIVGDFRKAILWDRMQATIRVTDGYLDFVVKNLVLILAEMRAAFGVIRPEAFVSIDLAAGT